jgi:hypothetical protein
MMDISLMQIYLKGTISFLLDNIVYDKIKNAYITSDIGIFYCY